MTITLIILPLYPNLIDGYIYSVNLFSYVQTTTFNLLIYWIMFITLIVIGGIKVLLNQIKIEKGQKLITNVSIAISVMTILFLAMTREAYAITMAFLLMLVKGILILRIAKTIS